MAEYRFRAPDAIYDDEYYWTPFAPQDGRNTGLGPQGFYGNGLGIRPEGMAPMPVLRPGQTGPSADEWTDETGRPPYTGSQERYHNPQWDLRSMDAMLQDPLVRALMKRKGIG